MLFKTNVSIEKIYELNDNSPSLELGHILVLHNFMRN